MGDHPYVELKRPSGGSCRSQKRRESIQTAGRWPRKLESAKECVTTHRPNALALKMDGAQAARLYSTLGANATRRGVDVRAGTAEAFAVRRRGGAGSVDLGCSSEYSSETLEGRSGKWFRLNSIWRRVSRS